MEGYTLFIYDVVLICLYFCGEGKMAGLGIEWKRGGYDPTTKHPAVKPVEENTDNAYSFIIIIFIIFGLVALVLGIVLHIACKANRHAKYGKTTPRAFVTNIKGTRAANNPVTVSHFGNPQVNAATSESSNEMAKKQLLPCALPDT